MSEVPLYAARLLTPVALLTSLSHTDSDTPHSDVETSFTPHPGGETSPPRRTGKVLRDLPPNWTGNHSEPITTGTEHGWFHLRSGSGFRVQGSGFRVQGSGFKVQGSGSRVQA